MAFGTTKGAASHPTLKVTKAFESNSLKHLLVSRESYQYTLITRGRTVSQHLARPQKGLLPSPTRLGYCLQHPHSREEDDLATCT